MSQAGGQEATVTSCRKRNSPCWQGRIFHSVSSSVLEQMVQRGCEFSDLWRSSELNQSGPWTVWSKVETTLHDIPFKWNYSRAYGSGVSIAPVLKYFLWQRLHHLPRESIAVLLHIFFSKRWKKDNHSKQLRVLTGLNQLLEIFGTFTLQCCDKAWQPEQETEHAEFLAAELKEMEIVKHFKSWHCIM